VVAALAGEVDRLQRADRARMQRYERAAQSYLAEFRATVPIEEPLEDAHAVAVRLAERSLPTTLEGGAS
jgi:hypothetical protein